MPVPGSVMAWDNTGPLEVTVQGRSVTLSSVHQEPQAEVLCGFVSYRPQLEMLIIGCRLVVDEWNVQTAWELELEEI
jgi:hypothetical protein